jgi:hypothetical protein
MSEPLVERLNGFTPDAGRLDRDALLFAAGRASVRPNRAGSILAGVLASTQVLTLALLWPHPAPPPTRPGVPQLAVEPPAPASAERTGLWTARHSLLDAEAEDCPAPPATGNLVESEPPLRAFSRTPPSILN